MRLIDADEIENKAVPMDSYESVHYCKLPHMIGVEVFKEFFCYYGERKEGADNA